VTDLPSGWEWATLEDLLAPEPRAITDGPFGSNLKSSHYTESGPRVIRLQNVGDMVFNDEYAHISSDHFEQLRAHEVKAGDLVIASLGDKLPRVCILPQFDVPAIVKADCIRVRLHPEINTKWVLYALSAPQSRLYAASRMRGVGRPRLGLGAIRQIPIPVPPPEEQKRIVEFLDDRLSELEAGDRVLREATEKTDALWRSVLAEVYDGTLAKANQPAPMRRLDSVATVQGGIQKQPRRRPILNKYPFLRVANVARGRLDLGEIHEVELFDGELARYHLEVGDLLVVEGNGAHRS
jgi:type I restriction enzyme S subunit